MLTDDVFTAWARDRANGLDSIMLAPTRELASQLNQRAQTHRLTGTTPGAGVPLADGNTAHVGDLVITRTNDRRLRVSATDWVKNGDRWTVLAAHPDGSLRVRHARHGRVLTLPAAYVSGSTELGYATTVHGAQGVSADTMHGLATGAESRQQLYTMLTRGRHANHLYLQVVGDGDPHAVIRPENLHPPTATDLLEAILARDDAPTSASTMLREQADPATRLAHATARYVDALHVAAEHHLGPHTVARLDAGADRVVDGITDDPAWPTLRAHLILLAANGGDPLTHLHLAAAARELDTAGDRAAVLDWRLDDTGLRNAGPGPLPWLPGIPTALRDHETWGPYLAARADLVTDLAAQVHDRVPDRSRPPRGPVRDAARPDATSSPTSPCGGPRPASPTPTSGPPAPSSCQGRRPLAAHPGGPGRRRPLPRPGRVGAAAGGARSRRPQPTPSPRCWPSGSPRSPAPASTPRPCSAPPSPRAPCPTTTPPPRCGGGSAATSPPPSPPGSTTGHDLTPTWATRLAAAVGADRAAQLQDSPWWPAAGHHRRPRPRPRPAPRHDHRHGRDRSTRPSTSTSARRWCGACPSWPTPSPDEGEDHPRPRGRAVRPALGRRAVVAGRGRARSSRPPPRTSGTSSTLTPAATAADLNDDLADDVATDLAAAALYRQSMGVLEPTDAQIQRMLDRAAAWDHAVADRTRLTHINAMAMDFYAQRVDTGWAGAYLDDRLPGWRTNPHVTAGYAPAGWTALVDHLGGRGVTDDELLETGLATRARTGTLIDRFRDRVVLPITHEHQILGFVARRHPDLTDDDTVRTEVPQHPRHRPVPQGRPALRGRPRAASSKARCRCSSKAPSTPWPSPSPATAGTSASPPWAPPSPTSRPGSSPP